MTRGVVIRTDRVFLRRDRVRTVRTMPATTPTPVRPITDADCHKAQIVALLRTWNYSY
jgi:hypothetical protein